MCSEHRNDRRTMQSRTEHLVLSRVSALTHRYPLKKFN